MNYMSPLSIILYISWLLFLIFTVDGYKRWKLNLLHFVVFLWWVVTVLLWLFYPPFLSKFGEVFGLARGADILVYGGMIFLAYMFFDLNNKITKQAIKSTDILRVLAINSAVWFIEKDINTAIVMPTYRQNDNVIGIIEEIIDLWIGVIMIDDGFNGDLPTKIIWKFSKNVVVIKHPYNLWQGAALQTWQQYIYDNYNFIKYILHFDSDGQHQAKDIINFKNAFIKNSSLDIVLWSRFLPWSGKIPSNRAFHKKLQLLFMRIFVWIKLTDTNNGFRMIKYETIPKLKITMNDYSHASQIEHLIKQNRLKYVEVPVSILYEEEHIKNWQKLSNAFNIAKNIIYDKIFFR